MLTLTPNAASLIRNLTGQQDLPMGTGLRIATNDDGGLKLNLSPQPETGDQVVDESGARLFLEPQAADMLEDKALDAAVDADGAIQFAVSEKG